MDIFVLAGQSNMAGRGNVVRGADGKKVFQTDPSSKKKNITSFQPRQAD